MEKFKELYKSGIEKVESTFDTKRKKGIGIAVSVLLIAGAIFTTYALQPSGKVNGDGVNTTKPVDKDKVKDKDKTETGKSEKDKADSDKSETDKTETDNGEPSSGGSSSSESSGSGSSSGGNTPAPKPDPTPEPTPTLKPTPTPKPPTHVHTWTPVYKDHPAVAAQGYEEWVPDEVGNIPTYFFGNGHSVAASVIDGEYDGIGDYMADNGLITENYWVGYNVITPGYTKWVETVAAKPTWKELTHYVCHADGETKNP